MDHDFSFWTFTLPNYMLAVLTYTLLGRIVLSFLFASRPDAVINRVFAQITDPVLRIIRVITPQVVGNGLVIVLAIIWLLALRMLLFLVTRAFGLAPTNVI
ncbi:YggT family protein [Rhabdaerophilum sp. SD176]|uniref:YggT family protein n=1 Tax=Rhabdaerophilum sp. SD176 TaxID=2983548 RepID=UPI0024E036B1|nr:YggT family protein [Rhabdaerophilum sp. SD176]